MVWLLYCVGKFGHVQACIHFFYIFIVIKYLIIKALYEKMCELLSKHKFNKQEKFRGK